MKFNTDPRANAIAFFFEHMGAEDVEMLGRQYTEDAFFKDPFNELQGLAGVQRIYAHMFESLTTPRFEVIEAVIQGNQCFLVWNFQFSLKGELELRSIHGSSHLRLASDGRIAYHRDYWDAGEEFYEKLPLLHSVLRWIKRKVAAPAAQASR